MKKYTIKLTVKVADCWVNDGAELDSAEWKRAIEEKVKELLPYAYDHEFIVKIEEVKSK